jgi:hypothetical protein
VRQPLTAIVASGAALKYLEKASPDHEKIRQSLSRIISESHRTGAVPAALSPVGKAGLKQAVDVNGVFALSAISRHGIDR